MERVREKVQKAAFLKVHERPQKASFFKDDTVPAYIMMLPMLIGFLLFTIYPIFYVLKYAWFEYNGFTYMKFTGFYNFIRLFSRDPVYWMSVLNTFAVTFAKLIIELPIALVLAVLLNSKAKSDSFFRTVFFMPTIISTAIVGLIFSILFNSYNGIVNTLLMQLGFIGDKVNWFADKWLAMSVIIITAVWQHFGVNMIFFIMGLQSVPNELYECAEIDGANSLQKFFKITVPMLAPILQIVIMLAIVEGMKMTEMVLVLTNGMPGGKTEVVMTYIYKYFFNIDGYGSNQYGYASAMSIVTAVLIGIITLLYLRMSKKLSQIY